MLVRSLLTLIAALVVGLKVLVDVEALILNVVLVHRLVQLFFIQAAVDVVIERMVRIEQVVL